MWNFDANKEQPKLHQWQEQDAFVTHNV